jgi:hypothetical protein
MGASDEGREHVASLMVALDKHTAFLEGAIGIEMTPMFREDDLLVSEIAGMDTSIACRLVFPSRTSASGWMDDTLLFNTLEDLVTFLDHVVLLFHIARAQQRGE